MTWPSLLRLKMDASVFLPKHLNTFLTCPWRPSLAMQDGADTLCRQLVDDSQLTPRLKALRARELARGLDPELLRRFVLYVRRYRYPVSMHDCSQARHSTRRVSTSRSLRELRGACA